MCCIRGIQAFTCLFPDYGISVICYEIDSGCTIWALLQDQFERVAGTVLDQATWLPAEGRKAIENWVESYKTGRENFKKYVDDSYKKVEDFFAA